MPPGAIPFPFGECRICSDKATGVHYGVATCEGCKGFFKRSTTKAEKYKCFFGSQCVITPQNRNRCKYCRYQRCLEKGMAIDAVKMGRIPKIDKERALEAARSAQGVRTQGNVDEGHLSSSDSGISDSTCQQIAERIFPTQPNGDYQLPGLTSSSDCGSMDLPLRSSETPCSVTSANSDMFTVQSSSGKRWHYSSEMIKELLNQVMGSGSGKDPNILRKLMRSLGQQQDNTDKKAALHDSGIDSPNSVDIQSICKKLGRSSNTDDKNCRLKPLLSQNGPYKLGDIKVKKSSLPHVGQVTSAVPFHEPTHFSGQGGGSAQFQPSNPPLKRPGDNDVEGQPAAKVSTLETLLRNQFLPPSKMEDIDRFLSDALRHSGNQVGESYEDLLDSTASVASQATDVLSPEILHTSLPASSKVEPFLLPSDGGTNPCNPGQLHEIERPIPPATFGQLSNPFQCSPHSPLSSPVDSRYYPDHRVVSPSIPPTLTSTVAHTTYPSYMSSGSTAYNSEIPGFSPNPVEFPSSNMAFQGAAETFEYLNDSRTKTQPFGMDSNFHGHPVRLHTNYDSADANKRFGEPHTQYSLDNRYPPMTSPVVTSPPPQPYHPALPHGTLSGTSDAQAKPTLTTDASSALCPYGIKSEDYLCYDKDLMFDDMEPPSSALIPTPSEDLFLSPAELGKEGQGRNEALMERTLQRLAEADLKHNQQLRDNRDWMKKCTSQGFCRHPPADKSQSGIERTWNELIGSVEPINARIIGFSNDVPGFNSLDGDDRKLMAEKAYYDIWMVTAAPFFVCGESYLQFPCGEPYTREWMTYFLKEDFVDMMFDFAERLNSCKLTDLEMAVLCAIQLTYPDREGIKKLEEARSLHSHYLDVLDYSMSKSHPNNHSRLLIDIFKLLPQLTKINQLQQEIIANFAIDGPPGMSRKTNESDQSATINDLQNRFRDEMSLSTKSSDAVIGDGSVSSTQT